jgi:hypothetical protein
VTGDKKQGVEFAVCGSRHAENLTGFYKQADGQTKREIPGCIFSEILVFEKGKVVTRCKIFDVSFSHQNLTGGGKYNSLFCTKDLFYVGIQVEIEISQTLDSHGKIHSPEYRYPFYFLRGDYQSEILTDDLIFPSQILALSCTSLSLSI